MKKGPKCGKCRGIRKILVLVGGSPKWISCDECWGTHEKGKQ